VLVELGALFAQLHRIPPLAGDWGAFVAENGVACVERQRRWGVPEHLVAEIPRYLAAAGSLTDPAPVFLHADVTPQNLLLAEDRGRWRISGLVDFGDAMPGHREYDLLVPAIFLARGRRPLLEALFGSYGYGREELDGGWRGRLTALAILHRFNDLTRFLDGRPPASLGDLALVLWP
jgi:hygromycin-B 7''-O-kinase